MSYMKQAYEIGVIAALSDAGLTKDAIDKKRLGKELLNVASRALKGTKTPAEKKILRDLNKANTIPNPPIRWDALHGRGKKWDELNELIARLRK